jgi:hypothetical membrane protein
MRILALGGVAGPVVFTLVVLVGAALRPDYDHSMQVMSALGETGGPNALLMNAVGFVPTGLLILGFAFSLSRLVPRTALATAGGLLLCLFGLGIVGAGAFSCDPGCSGVGTSRDAYLHIVASVVAFLSGVTACAIWGFAFRALPAWRSLSSFSLASALLSTILLLTFNATAGSSSFPGVWQRLFLGSLFLWCGVVALYAFRISAPNRHAGCP